MPYQSPTPLFNADYANFAKFQKRCNKQIIADLVTLIPDWFPHAKTVPLRILDLGCGDGGSTAYLLKKLKKASIKVELIKGYDISPGQIEKTKEHSAKHPELIFELKDAEQLDAKDEYDLVISLFTLHWIKNIGQLIENIHKALKNNGHLMFFVPLEKSRLFSIREEHLKKKEWQPYFENFQIHPFRESAREYTDEAGKFFIAHPHNCARGRLKTFPTKKELSSFFMSWTPESRKTPEDIRNDYVTSLVNSIPVSNYAYTDITSIPASPEGKENEFNENYLLFSGSKDPNPLRNNHRMQLIPELSPLQVKLAQRFVGFEQSENFGEQFKPLPSHLKLNLQL